MSVDEDAGKRHAFPLRQLQILLACRLVEPLAINSIVTYLFPMVKHAAPQLTDAEATKLVTLLFSAYSLAQFATNIVWGRLSDHIGRRPVMLLGLAGVLVSTLGFAFSTTTTAMFAFRVAAGVSSGNIVITRTMIGDMVHGRENKARAFAWNQTAYQLGTVIGPVVGGYLVQPCAQIPGLCRDGRFGLLEAYPFALPNLLIACLLAVGWLVAYFYLEESLVPSGQPSTPPDEETSLLGQDRQDGALVATVAADAQPSHLSVIFAPKVVHVTLSYAFMALHTICFDQIFPVFLATSPVADQDQTRPPLVRALFYTKGGLGYASTTVASFVSASGLLSIALMVSIFPPVDTRFGSLRCLRASLLAYPLLYALLPYLVLLPQAPAWICLGGVSLLFALKTLAAVFSFNDNAILLNVAAPSPQALGLVNGVAQTAANGARALGPASMGFFISLGDRAGSNAFGWWFLAAVAVMGAVQGFWVSDEKEGGEP